MAAEGEFPKADGDVLYASEINGLKTKIIEIYEGDGFDVTGTETDEYELSEVTNVPSGENYILLSISFKAGGSAVHTGGGFYIYGDSDLKAEIKEIGGSYSTIFDLEVGPRDNISKLTTISRIIALTEGQKTSGFQIKITGTSASDGIANGYVTNHQTVLAFAGA